MNEVVWYSEQHQKKFFSACIVVICISIPPTLDSFPEHDIHSAWLYMRYNKKKNGNPIFVLYTLLLHKVKQRPLLRFASLWCVQLNIFFFPFLKEKYMVVCGGTLLIIRKNTFYSHENKGIAHSRKAIAIVLSWLIFTIITLASPKRKKKYEKYGKCLKN